MTAWNYIVIALSLALLAVLLTCEWKRVNKARLPWRLLAVVVLVTALAAIALPITFKRRLATGDKEGVLLTEGYDPDSVRLFMQAKHALVWVSPADVEARDLSALHLFGYGLTKAQCAILPAVPLVFHPSRPGKGVVSVDWRRSLWPGEVCRIQGRFYNPGGGTVKLLLTGMHSVLDSAEIKSGEGSDFELRTVPVQAGRAIYRLLVLNGADTLEREPIPVEVTPNKTLKVLMLAAAPDFENRFLASWLSEGGHSVVIRTAISQGKYDHTDLNMAAGPVDHLTPALLDKFDVVIADARELKAMPAGEYGLLRRSVEQKGMGLIIRADSTSGGMDKPGARSMIRDSLHRTLVSASMYGAGNIVLTTLQDTYVRQLEGHKKEYASLWTSLLQQAAGENRVGNDAAVERWQLEPALPVVGQPVKALLWSAGSGLPQGLFEEGEGSAPSVVTYLEQHPLLPFAWEGLYWPRVAGWQSVHTSQGDRTWWYAWGADDWRALYRMERTRQTERWIAGAGEKNDSGRGEKVRRAQDGEDQQVQTGQEGRQVQTGKGWFYLLVVLCCLFLWVERKI